MIFYILDDRLISFDSLSNLIFSSLFARKRNWMIEQIKSIFSNTLDACYKFRGQAYVAIYLPLFQMSVYCVNVCVRMCGVVNIGLCF